MENFPNNNNNSNEAPQYGNVYGGGYGEFGTNPPAPMTPEKKGMPLYAVVIIILVTVVVTFQVTSLWYQFGIIGKSDNDVPSYFDNALIIDEYLREHYIGEMDEEYISQFLASALLYASGDAYAYYYTPEEYKNATMSNQGSSVGLGIMVDYREDMSIGITRVSIGSPADLVGIRVGDVITAINGKDLALMSYKELNVAMQGEAGSSAVLKIQRGDEVIEFTVVRDKFVMQSVDGHVYKDGNTAKKIGVIEIYEFNSATTEQFIGMVNDFVDQGVEALVFDVRGNGGGTLDSVVDMLNFLLPEGKLVRITDKNGKEVQYYTSDANCIDLPMAVLTDGETASAAELFTSVLKDYGKAISVGTQTYGKGTIQIMIPLPDGGAFKFSYRYYSPPISDNFNGVGIPPEIEITLPEGTIVPYLTDENDPQLSAAVEHLLNAN